MTFRRIRHTVLMMLKIHAVQSMHTAHSCTLVAFFHTHVGSARVHYSKIFLKELQYAFLAEWPIVCVYKSILELLYNSLHSAVAFRAIHYKPSVVAPAYTRTFTESVQTDILFYTSVSCSKSVLHNAYLRVMNNLTMQLI